MEISESLANIILDALSAHIAILDEKGVILKTNRAWQNFADVNRLQHPAEATPMNYLSVCDLAKGDHSKEAKTVAEGIRSVIKGEVNEFLLDYPCHSPNQKRWFYMRVTRIPGPGPMRAVVSHENITALKLAEEALKAHEKELELKTQHLEETNTALKVLLQQREKDKAELESKVLQNINVLISPYVAKLKNKTLKSSDKALVDIIDTNLQDIVSPLLQRLVNAKIILTPQEIQVAALVKEGKSTKEIADILTVSETTVSFHRKNLRKKLGLDNTRKNLRAHLLSLSD
ncbi:MAG: LuxR C-terminal-related transcriptional regulator [Desulfobacterales bacterium]|jgi:DNA-binding CsgD family transcriptional regulator|nr:helix-turn-helix transcriptional regulator [Deltaproteobacteria bacterium]